MAIQYTTSSKDIFIAVKTGSLIKTTHIFWSIFCHQGPSQTLLSLFNPHSIQAKGTHHLALLSQTEEEAQNLSRSPGLLREHVTSILSPAKQPSSASR